MTESKSPTPTLSGPFRALLAAAVVVVLGAAVRAASPVIVPFLVALLLAAVMRPAVVWLEKRGVSQWIGIPVLLLLTAAVLFGVGTILTETARQLQAELPRYVARLQKLAGTTADWLDAHGVVVPGGAFGQVVDADRVVDVAGGALRGLANIMSNFFLVVILTVFILIEANGFPRKLDAINTGFAAQFRGTGVVREIQRYLALKTALSLATGILITVWVWLVGLDFPFFWGLVAFILNYIPTLGSIIAAIPAVLLALVQLGLGDTIMVGAGYLVVNTVIGNFIDPNVLGHGLSLSPLVVILSLLFWGWLLGPLGLLLAPVLTMILRITAENTPGGDWVAKLLGPVPRAHPD